MLLTLIILSLLSAESRADDTPRRVLILHAYNYTFPATTLVSDAARKRLLEVSQQRLEIEADFLDLARLPGETHALRMATFLHEKYADRHFDLVVSINTLHNLYLPDLFKALREIERVGRRHKFIVMDSYRNEREKVNLLYWQLTCECFFTPAEWEFIFRQTGYTGDWDFVCFE